MHCAIYCSVRGCRGHGVHNVWRNHGVSVHIEHAPKSHVFQDCSLDYVTNPITKYALTMTPLALSLEELLPSNRQTYGNIIMLRSALVLSSLVVALSVPFFGLVMSLVGSLLTMFVAYILPCACFLAILRSTVTWSQIVLCVFIIVVGLCCAGVGTYSSLSKIIQNYQ
ncbi:unnamed protein product [Triticum turgidum subsp. durum]|uniref:Amino acid transporter transmembrane domain-containing protein n=1 Tax=Triticum turgidum subsp. durum TaxID=4567 RepID=A0A9R1PCG9_TRITD|nr:unnamed protein product [Triticum turgidum subsp. durum]